MRPKAVQNVVFLGRVTTRIITIKDSFPNVALTARIIRTKGIFTNPALTARIIRIKNYIS